MTANASKMKYNEDEIKQLVANMSETEKAMVTGMRMHGVDVVSVTTEVHIREKDGKRYAVPEYRVTNQGFTLPILDWSFVSFDPTRWGFAVCLDKEDK